MTMTHTARFALLSRVVVAGAALLSTAVPAFATNLQIADVHAAPPQHVTFTVRWQNGWRHDRNHDAAWLFVKQRDANGAWQPALLRADGHTLTAIGGPQGRLQRSDDGVGVFAIPTATHRGDVTWNVRLALAQSAEPGTAAGAGSAAPARARPIADGDVQVFGLEVVFVPSGAFTLGDPDPKALEFGAVYRSDASGEPDGLVAIASEAPIEVGPRAGALYYKVQQPQYQGDRLGPIPATFPKGFQAFYAMKYEITQGQYAEFLNAISSTATFFRAIHGGRGYATQRGTNAFDGRAYVASAPNRPANWIGWDDGLAFADWAGLRPMTELEFTKACRGSSPPLAHEFPWGTPTADRLRRQMGPDDDLVTTGEADESRLTEATRDVLGASFYWVMDLAGSVWERVVTFGHPRGRAFGGTHGDGRLTGHGNATNEDWPLGDHEAGGYGYRGGGYYERGMKVTEFNPYSPIAYRRFGSWGGAPRSIAYGFRAVRTAPVPEPAAYELVWADEFERDGRPDSRNWTYETGFVRNEELQWYQPERAWCENGRLIIESRRERKANPGYDPNGTDWRTRRAYAEYTSASVTTRGLHRWQFGRFEMRAKIDTRPGLWPAFWTLGVEGRWPANGEIDIMEYYRGMLLANVAWASGDVKRVKWDDARKPIAELGDAKWADTFHVWRMDWNEDEIRLYVDDILLNSIRLADTFNGDGSGNPLRQPHYLILNLAVGGAQGGDPSATTFPARYEIDYVRVYQTAGANR